MTVKKKKVFDVANYQIVPTAEDIILKLVDGTEIPLSIKPISWKRRNGILASSTITRGDAVVIDIDSYISSCLKEMIVTAPWGTTTDTFLSTINDELGDALATIVPKPNEEDAGGSIEVIKK
jgi:hypothetical protein